MTRYLLILWLFALIVLSGIQFSSAAQVQRTVPYRTTSYASYHLSREQIRQMPLLQRPNRPGHFYGNTVRRLYYGRRTRGR